MRTTVKTGSRSLFKCFRENKRDMGSRRNAVCSRWAVGEQCPLMCQSREILETFPCLHSFIRARAEHLLWMRSTGRRIPLVAPLSRRAQTHRPAPNPASNRYASTPGGRSTGPPVMGRASSHEHPILDAINDSGSRRTHDRCAASPADMDAARYSRHQVVGVGPGLRPAGLQARRTDGVGR